MIRTRMPGGVMHARAVARSSTRWRATFAERGLRITTRQAFQFHGVIKRELKPTMRAINAALVDTLAACGDVNRNVAVAANPLRSELHAGVYATAAALSEHLLPSTRAYHEIWLDEKRVAGTPEQEPIYGEAYLPRKFKIGFAVPPTNDVDVFAQDLGFIAIVEDGRVAGFNVTVGGGMGATHGDPETYPRLGDVIGFVEPQHVIALAVAVVTTQRDWGNRAVRKRARLKYTIDDRGLPGSRPRSSSARASRCSRRVASGSTTTATASAGSTGTTVARTSRCASRPGGCRTARKVRCRPACGRSRAFCRRRGRAASADAQPEPRDRQRGCRASRAGRCDRGGARPRRACDGDAGAARCAGLRGAADLRAGDGRGRALPAGVPRTRSKHCSAATACAMPPCTCASPAARTGARGRTSARSR